MVENSVSVMCINWEVLCLINCVGWEVVGKLLILCVGLILMVDVWFIYVFCLNIFVVFGDGYDYFFRVGKCKYFV